MNDHEINVALDHAQAIVSRFCKPLEALPAVLLAVREGREELKTLESERAQLIKDITDYRDTLESETESGGAKLEEIRTNAKQFETTLNDQLRQVQDETAAKIKALHAGAKAAQQDADKIIQTCTDARVIAEQELAALQTQIANAKNEYATFLKKIGGPV